MELPVELWHWGAFGVLVVILLVLDLCVLHRHDHEPSLKESSLFTVFWIALGLIFGGVIWWWGLKAGMGSRPGVEYLSGYLIEKALSMDNIFVFVIVFRYFQIPLKYQYRGILAIIGFQSYHNVSRRFACNTFL